MTPRTAEASRPAGVTDATQLVAHARAVIRKEADAVAALESRIGEAFVGAVECIATSSGRVIVSGIGKSGIIGRKIAATLTSTGTPANFLHPVEGMHGDLGIVGRDDVAILISKSGESSEMAGLIEFLARAGVPMIAMTARPESTLARAATVVLDCSVAEEACPHDLAPTTSTTATLAMGDALAVALLSRRGFTRDDFARLHPGGALGRKLTLRVADVMVTNDLPLLPPSATMRQAVVELAERRGTAAIVEGDGRLAGVVTSGDLTRLMERAGDFLNVPVAEVMTRDPKVAQPDMLASAAVHTLEQRGIMAMPVVDAERRVVGMVHLHDLMRAGAV
ncbi:MAG TPA: KpsF/GutQ family sugar-phosphate isomerase [Longimicrobiales bacterium]